jgi:hypothetical protein
MIRMSFFILFLSMFLNSSYAGMCSFRYVYEANTCTSQGGSLPRELKLSSDECSVLTMPGNSQSGRLNFMCSRLFGPGSNDSREFVACKGVPGLVVRAVNLEDDLAVAYRTIYKQGGGTCFEVDKRTYNCQTVKNYSAPENYNLCGPCNPEIKKVKSTQTQGWMGH